MSDRAEDAPNDEVLRELPIYLRAELSDLDHVDVESPIFGEVSADCHELSNRFTEAMKAAKVGGKVAAERVYAMLGATTGFHHRRDNRDAPYGPMWVMENSRSAEPADFRGAPLITLVELALRVRHPALKARICDICWLLDRSRTDLGLYAIQACIDLARGLQDGTYRLRFASDEKPELSFFTCDVLHRGLQISVAPSMRARAPREDLNGIVETLFRQAAQGENWVSVLRWGNLALDFGVIASAEVGRLLEAFAAEHPHEADYHNAAEVLQLAAKAYRYAKDNEAAYRCQVSTSDTLVAHAEAVGGAMLSSSLLADALSALGGVPNIKEKRQALKHRLVDAQADIREEMTTFSHPIDLKELIEHTERALDLDNLRDMLFLFASLERSPNPEKMREEAAKNIRQYPLSNLFSKAYHDSDGKLLHVTDAGNEEAQLRDKIIENEGFRRMVLVRGQIEFGRRYIVDHFYIADDVLAPLIHNSIFVPSEIAVSYSKAFCQFFHGDFTPAVYTLTPLLEASVRSVLKESGYDTTLFEVSTQTQKEMSLSAIFDKRRDMVVDVFGEDIAGDIERVFLLKPGPALRHEIAHGLISDHTPYSDAAIYGCWLIFRLCMLPLFAYRESLPVLQKRTA